MIKRLAVLLFVFGFVSTTYSQEKVQTIYLVRHAEKVIDKDNLRNPPLTDCGTDRAKALAIFFHTIDLEMVYSTDFIRTIETARPTAESKDLEIEIYSPGSLEAIAEMIIKRGEDVLIVGHSNSTPLLAGLFIGEQGYAIADNVYNQVYQVVIRGESKELNIFHTSFRCNNMK